MRDTFNEQVRIQHDTFAAIPREGGTLPDGRPVQIMPPEKNWAEENGLDGVPLFGWTSYYEERMERFQATNAEADRVMATYSSRTEGVVDRTPEFKPQEPEQQADAGQQATYGPSASSVMSGASYSSGPSMSGSLGGTASTSSAWAGSPQPASYTPPAASAASSPAARPVSPQVPASSGSAWAPSGQGSSLPPGVVRGPDGTLYRQGPNGEWLRQNSYNGRWAPAPNGPPGAAPRGGTAAGPRGGVAARPGGGFGPVGSGGSAGGAARGGSLAPGGRAGTSFGPSGSAPATTSSSASNPAGRGGMMRGAPMAGGQQGQGGEEEEHERPSWLIETEDVFTEDMHRVAPPVLGATPFEEQGR